MARRLAGISTVAVFTAIGVTLMLVGFAFNGPVRSELLPFLILSLLPVIVPPAVVPAGMRLAGQRLLPRPFVSTIGVVIAMQLYDRPDRAVDLLGTSAPILAAPGGTGFVLVVREYRPAASRFDCAGCSWFLDRLERTRAPRSQLLRRSLGSSVGS